MDFSLKCPKRYVLRYQFMKLDKNAKIIISINWNFLQCVQGVLGASQSSKEIKLTFEYVNGKFIPVVQKDPITDETGTMSKAAVSSVFLLLIIMLGIIGNALIVGTVLSSITLKR